MATEFKGMRISVEDGEVILEQFLMCEDTQVITFPTHQAESICLAITREVKTAEA